jgi:hypothetical protein
MSEMKVLTALVMDRPEPIGNSDDGTGRRALHFKMTNALIGSAYDQILATYPTTSSEVYTYKLSGNTVATVTVVYSDASKVNLVSVTKS